MMRHKLLRAGITIFIFGLSLVLIFASQIILARMLTIYEYGVFSTIYSAAAIISSLGTMGFDVSSLRFFPNLSELDRRSFFHLALQSTVGLTGILALVCAVIMLYLLDLSWITATLACGLIFGWAIVRLLSAIARGDGRFNLAIFIDRFCREGALVCFGVASLLIGLKLTLIDVLTIMLFGSLTGIILAFPVIGKLGFTLRKASHESQSIWMNATVGLLGINILELTISRIEIILASALLNAESAGVTSAIVFIGNAIAIPTIAANVMIMPIVAKQYRDSDGRNLVRTLSAFLAFSVLGGATIGIAMLYDTALFARLFGSSIAKEIDSSFLSLIILTKIIVLIVVPATPLILMSGKVRGLIISYSFILCAKIAASVLFVPAYGITGIVYILAGGSVVLAVAQAFLMLNIVRDFASRPKIGGQTAS